jgi:hypothetical protein
MMKNVRVYEPVGMFRILTVKKPLFTRGKIWFTQTLSGIYQLHVGIFDEAKKELRVWKSRTIHPRSKFVQKGIHRHPRNPVLDQPIWERIMRIPFLTNAETVV